jgi:hypothetical protein
MVRLVELVLEPGKRTCPPLATPAGASRLRCVPPPRLHRGGGAGGITPLQGTPVCTSEIACDDKQFTQVGTIPGLMGECAYKGSPCCKRSAGLQTPSGPWLSTKLGGAKTSPDSPSAPMPTIGLSRLLTPGPYSSPLWSAPRRISPWRPEPYCRLAAGLAAVGNLVLLLGMGAPRAKASSPDAWRAYDGELRRACLKASRLLQPWALGERTATQVKDRNRRWCVCV